MTIENHQRTENNNENKRPQSIDHFGESQNQIKMTNFKRCKNITEYVRMNANIESIVLPSLLNRLVLLFCVHSQDIFFDSFTKI